VGFSGTEVTEKGFVQGWDPATEDQGDQRAHRNTQSLEAQVFRPWAWNRHAGAGLRYNFRGGYVDDGVEWVLVADGSILLVDNETSFIERDILGVVSSNLIGFTYPGRIPMATVRTQNGLVIPETYVDSRPEVVGEPTGSPGFIDFTQIQGHLLPSQLAPSTCYLEAGAISPGSFFGKFCGGASSSFEFPNLLGIGGPPTLTTAPLQVYGDADLRGGLRLLNAADLAENVIFASGAGDEFAKITNFISDSTIWEVRSRTGLVNVDDREATLALTRTDNAGNEEILDLYNNGFFSSPNRIAVGFGTRIIKTGIDPVLGGKWRPYRFDWFHFDTLEEVPGYTILSPDDPGGPCFVFHIPVKLPFSQQMANDLFMETDLGRFVLSRATSRQPWTPHDMCASNAGFS